MTPREECEQELSTRDHDPSIGYALAEARALLRASRMVRFHPYPPSDAPRLPATHYAHVYRQRLLNREPSLSPLDSIGGPETIAVMEATIGGIRACSIWLDAHVVLLFLSDQDVLVGCIVLRNARP